MEQYYEQTVQRKPTAGERIMAVFVWIGAVIIAAAGFYLMVFKYPQYGGTLLALIFMLMVIMLAVLYTKRLSPEFCYEFIEGNINIDKIQKKGVRATLTRIDFTRITSFGRYTPAKKREYKPYRVFSAYTGSTKELWYTVCLADRGRRDMVIFEPDEQMLELIKRTLPIQLRLAVFGKGKETTP
ncbi:MAG TPA: DUF6106 family protein [Oscillospiraceae bacterium]|nr:DUF6106 family protein [Oscillospiraceae bacterium]HPF56299.1 DUF6106 family protein [Clostridiales bacterium]HPK35884.1 DUF6106 family protein [Oscillospiraceae bacterium]HPR76361.1 DUF6106 family protein [Oscillospiraceae bacterium]